MSGDRLEVSVTYPQCLLNADAAFRLLRHCDPFRLPAGGKPIWYSHASNIFSACSAWITALAAAMAGKSLRSLRVQHLWHPGRKPLRSLGVNKFVHQSLRSLGVSKFTHPAASPCDRSGVRQLGHRKTLRIARPDAIASPRPPRWPASHWYCLGWPNLSTAVLAIARPE
jgi:hypothetical protein